MLRQEAQYHETDVQRSPSATLHLPWLPAAARGLGLNTVERRRIVNDVQGDKGLQREARDAFVRAYVRSKCSPRPLAATASDPLCEECQQPLPAPVVAAVRSIQNTASLALTDQPVSQRMEPVADFFVVAPLDIGRHFCNFLSVVDVV